MKRRILYRGKVFLTVFNPIALHFNILLTSILILARFMVILMKMNEK